MLIFITAPSVWADTRLDTADYGSLSAALEAIPAEAGAVSLVLSPGAASDGMYDYSLPTDRGITEITLLAPVSGERIFLPDVWRICANGIPLTVGENVCLENASVYGGACVSGADSALESSSVTVAGTAAFVFGGGFAENGGSASVAEPSVTVSESGQVYFEVFGGGHAYGSGSRASADTTSVRILGTVDYALGGGFAENGGYSLVNMANMDLEESAVVRLSLFTGGSASGNGSLSEVDRAKTVMKGSADWAFSGDFAFEGGETRLLRDSRLEILAPASVSHAFLGSFASDEGSTARVDTSELMSCGTVELISKHGQSTGGGSAETGVPANFPCVSGETGHE